MFRAISTHQNITNSRSLFYCYSPIPWLARCQKSALASKLFSHAFLDKHTLSLQPPCPVPGGGGGEGRGSHFSSSPRASSLLPLPPVQTHSFILFFLFWPVSVSFSTSLHPKGLSFWLSTVNASPPPGGQGPFVEGRSCLCLIFMWLFQSALPLWRGKKVQKFAATYPEVWWDTCQALWLGPNKES